MTQNGAHASTLTVAGVEYRIRREFEIIVQIEEVFGEIGAFLQRAEDPATGRLKAVDLAKLYGILLSGQETPPAADVIKAHIGAVGTLAAFRPAIIICGSLFIGEERFMSALAARLAEGNGESPHQLAGR
jgi:hypothetical protein